MKIWRNLAAGVAITLSIAPPILARAHSHRVDPQPRDPAAIFAGDSSGSGPSEYFPKISAARSATLSTKDGGSLRLRIDLGDVHVFTDQTARISYRAMVEADSRDPDAREFLRQFNVTARRNSRGVALDGKVPWQGLRGRFTSTIEIHIPRRYNLEITSGGGNIDVQDIDGRIRVVSAGGNITVGRVGGLGSAGIAVGGKTQDGLTVRAPSPREPALPVAARVETQGGEISVGNVAGTLRAATAGGHIIAGNITGDVILRTGGGQIYAGRIEGAATLDTGGGNVHIESAGSSVAADTAGGALVLRQADAPVRVTANDGSVTAWLSDATASKAVGATDTRKARQSSSVTSNGGDIVLYIPRKLAATIDAMIEQGNGHRITADPSLPLQISYRDSTDGGRTIHCAAQLNGGGEVVRLKTVSGNIVLRSGDPDLESSAALPPAWAQGGVASAALEPVNSGEDEDFTDADGFFAEMRRRILESWWGGIPVDAEEMQKHLERSVAPVYPEIARHAGIEGDVVLRVYVSSSGRVTDLKVLDGPPILARAAAEAVQQWQYQAPRMNGRPASVVTTLVVSFRLH